MKKRDYYIFIKKYLYLTLDYYNLNSNESSTINDIIVFNKKLEKESNDFKNINKQMV